MYDFDSSLRNIITLRQGNIPLAVVGATPTVKGEAALWGVGGLCASNLLNEVLYNYKVKV